MNKDNGKITAYEFVLIMEAIEHMQQFIDYAMQEAENKNEILVAQKSKEVFSDYTKLFTKLLSLMVDTIGDDGSNPREFAIFPIVDVNIEEVFKNGIQQ